MVIILVLSIIVLCATLFFLRSGKAQKSGKSKSKAWLVAFLLLPVVLAGLAFIALCVGILCSDVDRPIPLSKDETPYTSREEIVAITGFSNFPEFEYLSSERYGGITIKYAFKDANEVENLFKTLKRKVNEKDNVYWSIDSTDNCRYHFNRGWDGEYMDMPAGCSDSLSQISMDIDSTGFEAYVGGFLLNDSLERYATADSLYALTGINFPKYQVVNMNHYGWAEEFGYDIALMLDKKPTKSFLDALSKSDDWTRNKEGNYIFYQKDERGWESHEIFVNPYSRIIKIKYFHE